MCVYVLLQMGWGCIQTYTHETLALCILIVIYMNLNYVVAKEVWLENCYIGQ